MSPCGDHRKDLPLTQRPPTFLFRPNQSKEASPTRTGTSRFTAGRAGTPGPGGVVEPGLRARRHGRWLAVSGGDGGRAVESLESTTGSGFQYVRGIGRRRPGSDDRGEPVSRSITVDHGTEFMSRALEDWAYQRGVQLDFTRPGKPTDNGHIESFNGKLRDECLNVHQFVDLTDAKHRIEAWRIDYLADRLQ